MAAPFLTRYRSALARVTASLGVPFGYTITVWASGALAIHYFGVPGTAAVLAFVSGAVLAYLVFGAVEYGAIREVETLRTRREVLFNAVPIAAATAVAVVDRVVDHPFLGWLLSGTLATATYILLLAAVWAWAEDGPAKREASRPEPGLPPDSPDR